MDREEEKKIKDVLLKYMNSSIHSVPGAKNSELKSLKGIHDKIKLKNFI